MGLFSRCSAWLADLFGGGNGDESSDGSARADTARGESDRAGDGEEPSSRLDPNATTEVRTDATDDAVDALRDVRQAQNAAVESDDGSTAAADGDRNADGDRLADANGDADSDPDTDRS